MTVAISPAPQFGNSTRVHAIFVAEGQVVKQIVDRMDALGAQHLGQARADALYILHRGGKLQHLSDVSRRQCKPPLVAGRRSLAKASQVCWLQPSKRSVHSAGGFGFRPMANDRRPRPTPFKNCPAVHVTFGTSVQASGAGYNPAGPMQKIAILYDASQAVLSTFDLDEVLQRILVIAQDYFHLQNVAILLLDKETDQLCTRSQIGGEQGFDKVAVSIGTGLIGTAAQKKRPLYVPDFTKETRYKPWGKKTRSELAIPLMVRDEMVGVLDCQSENPDHFDSETTRN